MSWIQDAVVLLESLQELSAVEPYSYLFEDAIAVSFQEFKREVLSYTDNEHTVRSELALERQDVVVAVNNLGSSLKH